MNIYKKLNEIIVSNNGCPEGWETIGFDQTITPENSRYVTGFTKGEATFDTAKIESDLLFESDRTKSIAKQKTISQIENLEQKMIRPMSSMINNTATDQDMAVFTDIQSQIATLREGLE